MKKIHLPQENALESNATASKPVGNYVLDNTELL